MHTSRNQIGHIGMRSSVDCRNWYRWVGTEWKHHRTQNMLIVINFHFHFNRPILHIWICYDHTYSMNRLHIENVYNCYCLDGVYVFWFCSLVIQKLSPMRNAEWIMLLVVLMWMEWDNVPPFCLILSYLVVSVSIQLHPIQLNYIIGDYCFFFMNNELGWRQQLQV